jgi:long-chain acyl-CoA synthetase
MRGLRQYRRAARTRSERAVRSLNRSSRDVEEVLYEVPQVKEVVVIGIAGQPIAFVIPHRDRPTAETLIAYCRRRLPPELVPRLVFFVDEFPRTFIGKVLRRELAKRVDATQLRE